MAVNRRDFLRTGMTAGALAVTPRWLHGVGRPMAGSAVEMPSITDPTVRELALRAVEAARTAGAAYADVRLSHTRLLNLRDGDGPEKAWLDVGVRALVNGYWGFAASPLWTADEMVRLGREAVHQAQANARIGKARVVELSPIPVIRDGHWTMPVERDPFEVPHGEIQDFVKSLQMYVTQRRHRIPIQNMSFAAEFHRQDKAFASSEGSYCTQRLYRTMGGFSVGGKIGTEDVGAASNIIRGAAGGWEYIREAPLREEFEQILQQMEADYALPKKPLEVGRYDIVFSPLALASLLDGTLGAATELDRALGYEANAGGTSYLNDPLGMVGHYQVGAPLLSVTADRATPGALATVKWDDEGVEPDQFTIVKDGVLVDFPTHREGTGWLQERYAALGRGAARSHGCAAAARAYEAPLIFPPNLTIAPGKEALDYDDLVAGLKKGLAIKNLFRLTMDFQCLNGFGSGGLYEVKDGKRVARIQGKPVFLFRAPGFWKALQALGGAASQRPFPFQRTKGEPAQEVWHTVTAVPAVVKQVNTVRGA